MNPDKILIIDDKIADQGYSTVSLLESLTEVDKKKIEFHKSLEQVCDFGDDGESVYLKIDLELYSFVFIHGSYDDPLLDENSLDILIREFSKKAIVVLFSGSKRETVTPALLNLSEVSGYVKYYGIKRQQYFDNFHNFISSYNIYKEYRIKYLYDGFSFPKQDRGNELKDEIEVALEISKDNVLNSSIFSTFLELYNLNSSSYFLNSVRSCDELEFLDILENVILTLK